MIKNRFKNFTVVELLVVVSILVILSSLIHPSLRQILHASYGVKCINNQKFLGVAFENYVGDYTKYPLPRATHSKSNDITRYHVRSWDDFLGQGYDGRNLSIEQVDQGILVDEDALGSEVYACALDKSETRDYSLPNSVSNRHAYIGKERGAVRSYAMNSYRGFSKWWSKQDRGIGGYYPIQGTSDPIRSTPWSQDGNEVESASKTFLLVEFPGIAYVGAVYWGIVYSPESQDGQRVYDYVTQLGGVYNTPIYNRYHANGWNYLFVDGHVENLLPEETIASGGTFDNPNGSYWTLNPND